MRLILDLLKPLFLVKPVCFQFLLFSNNKVLTNAMCRVMVSIFRQLLLTFWFRGLATGTQGLIATMRPLPRSQPKVTQVVSDRIKNYDMVHHGYKCQVLTTAHTATHMAGGGGNKTERPAKP